MTTPPPPNHRALTRRPAPALDFSRPGTPASSDFGDIYFSVEGGLEETRAVYLQGCGLPERWMGRAQFTIAELGFGSGLNMLAAWQMWEASGASGASGRLHLISVEGFPLEREQLARALSAFPELAHYADRLLTLWPGPVAGIHRLPLSERVTLTLLHDEVGAALAGQDFRADAWFLDGFSPAKNPAMWTSDVLSEVARLSAPGAVAATFTVAGGVRRGLAGAGFDVSKQPGFGRKRERLEAIFPGEAQDNAAPRTLPTIIGNGIGGASIAAAFARRGLLPRVIYDPDHIEASGNGAALVKPRLDLQDSPHARFFLAAFLYARTAYSECGAIQHEGVAHLAKTEAEASRLARIAKQAPLGPGHLEWREDDGPFGTLSLPSSLVIDTQVAREAMLANATIEARKIDRLSNADGPVIVAAGYGLRALCPDLPIRAARGQLAWTTGAMQEPVTYGGYAIPIRGEILLGATHERVTEPEQAFALTDADNQVMMDQGREMGLELGPDVRSYRASVRMNSADILPRILKLERDNTKQPGQDVTVLTGLGSRGFVFAPLLGEAIVSDWLGEPGPLTRAQWARFSRPLA